MHFSKLFLILKSGVNHTSRGSISTSTLPSIKLRKCSSKIITSILSFISGRLATKSNQIKQLIRNGRSASLQRTFKKSFTSFSHSTRNKTRDRSEERRVGKECRLWWAAQHRPKMAPMMSRSGSMCRSCQRSPEAVWTQPSRSCGVPVSNAARFKSIIADRLAAGSTSSSLFFFFKQKTAYDIGLGIPAEPLFRSRNGRSASLQRTFKKSFTSFSHSTRNKTRDGLIRVRNIRALNGRFNTSITHAYSIVIGSKHITLNATGGGFLTASKQFRHGATSKSRSNTASNSTKHKSPHLSGWRQIISLIT